MTSTRVATLATAGLTCGPLLPLLWDSPLAYIAYVWLAIACVVLIAAAVRSSFDEGFRRGERARSPHHPSGGSHPPPEPEGIVSNPANCCGPIEFRYRKRPSSNSDRVGANQLKCDVDGCNGGATWTASVLGWDVGIYCNRHKQEWLDVTDGILNPDPEAVAA